MPDKIVDTEKFRARRAAEVESDAYQLAKKALLTSEKAVDAFDLLLQEAFEIHEMVHALERKDFEFWEALNRISRIECKYHNLKDNLKCEIKEYTDRTIEHHIGFQEHGGQSVSQIVAEKGSVMQRLASLEQKMNAIRPHAKSLRKDGLFIEQYNKFYSDMCVWQRLLLIHLNQPKWWQLRKRYRKWKRKR